MELLGILAALGLLIWLAYRGWSILLLAPAAAVLAVGLAGEPPLDQRWQIRRARPTRRTRRAPLGSLRGSATLRRHSPPRTPRSRPRREGPHPSDAPWAPPRR